MNNHLNSTQNSLSNTSSSLHQYFSGPSPSPLYNIFQKASDSKPNSSDDHSKITDFLNEEKNNDPPMYYLKK